MLGLLMLLVLATKLNDRPLSTKLFVVVPYIIVMIAIDVVWRMALKRHMPGWYTQNRY